MNERPDRLTEIESRLVNVEKRVAHLEDQAQKATEPPPRPLSWLFVRQTRWAPADVVSQVDGAIVATRYNRRAINRAPGWWTRAAEEGVKLAGFDWLPLPGEWLRGLAEQVHFLRDVGAEAFCANIEPLPPKAAKRWEGQHDEMRRYVTEARRLCDGAGLEFWFSSWARPSARRSFPWAEIVPRAHVCIPQPYEVHGRAGDDYVSQVLAEWKSYGAKRIILGRGLHELDRSDDDAWRTPAEIRAHRESTPEGYDEAWWPAAGKVPQATLDAALD